LYPENGDLWSAFLCRIKCRTACTTFKWCKSHATAIQISSGVISKADFVGNAFADSFADLASDAHQHIIDDIDKYQFVIARTVLIQRRLVSILQRCQDFDLLNKTTLLAPSSVLRYHTVRPERVPVIRGLMRFKDFLGECVKLGHSPTTSTGARGQAQIVSCFHCKRQVKQRHFRLFLHEGRCTPLTTSSSSGSAITPFSSFGGGTTRGVTGGESAGSAGPVAGSSSSSSSSASAFDNSGSVVLKRDCPSGQAGSPAGEPAIVRARVGESGDCTVPERPPLLGRTRLHFSHVIAYRQGIFLCLKCGNYAASRVGNLGIVCSGRCTMATRKYRDRWSRGLPPRPGMQWPNQHDCIAPGIVWRPV
jgi:hypothetical protein